MIRRYIIGIIVLIIIIIVGWSVSIFGNEGYSVNNIATTTTSSLDNLGTTTNNVDNDIKISTTTVNNIEN